VRICVPSEESSTDLFWDLSLTFPLKCREQGVSQDKSVALRKRKKDLEGVNVFFSHDGDTFMSMVIWYLME